MKTYRVLDEGVDRERVVIDKKSKYLKPLSIKVHLCHFLVPARLKSDDLPAHPRDPTGPMASGVLRTQQPLQVVGGQNSRGLREVNHIERKMPDEYSFTQFGGVALSNALIANSRAVVHP